MEVRGVLISDKACFAGHSSSNKVLSSPCATQCGSELQLQRRGCVYKPKEKQPDVSLALMGYLNSHLVSVSWTAGIWQCANDFVAMVLEGPLSTGGMWYRLADNL